MTLPTNKFTDLPPELRSRITSDLLTFKPERRSISIDDDESFDVQPKPLPNEMLTVAKFSPSFAEEVANLLQSSAQVLSNSTAHPLHEWVAALAPFVKAVDWHDFAEAEKKYQAEKHQTIQQEHFDHESQYAIKLFHALSANTVQLHVLDLQTLGFDRCKIEEKLSCSFVLALEQSAQSLREIGLRAGPICSNALQKVSLPSLQVAVISVKEIFQEDRGLYVEGASAQAFMQVLRALDGHAERSSRKTTLRELRLVNVIEAPCTARVKSCAGLFKAVRTLKLSYQLFCKHDHDAIANFVSLFQNLESLHWEGVLKPDNIVLIREACRKLEAMHIRFTPEYPQIGHSRDLVNLSGMFRSCQGKLRSFCIDATLTSAGIRALGEANPELGSLKMRFERCNIDALPILLGSHCRKLQTLHILLPLDEEDGLTRDDWRMLAEGLKRASENLCEISIGGDVSAYITEEDVEAMEQSITQIVEFLGERARKITFEAFIASRDTKTWVGLLSRLMTTCGEHARNLENIELSIVGGGGFHSFGNKREEREVWEQLLSDKKRMMAALPRLDKCFFLEVDDFAENRLAEIKE